MKINFNSDYQQFCHPRIMERMAKLATETNLPYGLDNHSKIAKKLIQKECKKDSDVFFLGGGTQTNLVFISSVLKPYECVIACTTGHINVHETGAIEATGHKVVTVEPINAKVTPKEIEKCVKYHCDEHMVLPRLVYISNSTELGTVYSLKELKDLRKICDKYHLYLYLDGARLGSALTSKKNDVTMADIAKLTDAFYIGGTKNGALLGEALVINNKELAKNYRFIIKQRGAMLAKGFVVGLQFEELFKDGLYYEIGKHENDLAELLRKLLKQLNIKSFMESTTNQTFVIISKKQADILDKSFTFERWQEIDKNNVAVRFVTSFATTKEDILKLAQAIKETM